MTLTSVSDLLPNSSAYLFAYIFPLLTASLISLIGGTFLTLDRSRSFPPSYNAVPREVSDKKYPIPTLSLQGGIGGIVIGFTFGVHCATFLSLMIPATSGAAPLTRTSFLVIWILSSVSIALITAKWSLGALLFSGINGGALFALALCVMIHPALITRAVLVTISTLLLTIATMLPNPRSQRPALRFTTSASGAFGIVLSIALLSKASAWSDCWEHLWVKDGEDWGTSAERGLSAAFCILLLLGLASDWVLHRKFGECPDEKWDHYLADYTSNSPDRQGTFRPLVSFWDRVFGVTTRNSMARRNPNSGPFHRSQDIKDGRELASLTQSTSGDRFSAALLLPRQARQVSPSPLFFSKKSFRSPSKLHLKTKRMKSPAAFRSSKGSSISIENEDNVFPELDHSDATSGPSHSHSAKLSPHNAGPDPALEYSDLEEDLGRIAASSTPVDRDQLGWKPNFLRYPISSSGSCSSSTTAVGALSIARDPPLPPTCSPLASSPATPSLLKALDRVSQAYHVSQNSRRPGLPTSSSLNSSVGGDGLVRVANIQGSSVGSADTPYTNRWDSFWKDVQLKAARAGNP
jgi:hypothetical protein